MLFRSRADRAGLLQVLLTEFEQETGAFADYASRHRLPVITPELLQACIEKTGVPVQTKFVTDFVMYRYRQSPVYAQIQKQKNRRKEMDAR